MNLNTIITCLTIGMLSAGVHHEAFASDQRCKLCTVLENLAAHGDAEAQYCLGYMYYSAKDVEKESRKAIEMYTKAAEQGHAGALLKLGELANKGDTEACFNLGHMYETGRGVEKDKKKAVASYFEAAKQGYAKAQSRLGELAYDQGDAEAQFSLGVIYYYLGKGAKEDYEKALALFTKASERGLAEATFNLGDMYYKGKGVNKNCKKAEELFTKAAEQGFDEAKFTLGNMYYNGDGVEENKKEAVELLTKAAEKGHDKSLSRLIELANKGDTEAEFSLGNMYDENSCGSKFVEKNNEKAIEWWTKAAKQGHVEAQCNLGWAYCYGEGVDEDKEKAVELYTKAALQGYDVALDELMDLAQMNVNSAQLSLSNMYYNGECVMADKKKALELLIDAVDDRYYKAFSRLHELADQGDVDAQFYLADMYDVGRRWFLPDKEKAIELYTKAAVQRHFGARSRLHELANQGDANAQFGVAYMGECDQLLMRFHKEGVVKWYAKAAEQEHAKALSKLNEFADQGVAEAQYCLGHMYECAEGVGQDYGKAVEWYTKAAEQRHANAQFRLGYMYDGGEGVTEDKEKAVEWYTKAAELGHAEAQFNLGDIYYYGDGVVKEDKEKAFEWLFKAAQKGYEDACGMLFDLYKQGDAQAKKVLERMCGSKGVK